jgi:5-methylcytosine-specific restriction enzyme subunit McrC
MSDKHVIELKEYEQAKDIYLPEETAVKLRQAYSKVVQLQHTSRESHYSIRPGSVAGVFRVGNYTFRISPKVDLPVIWDWLAATYDLSSLQWSRTESGFQKQLGDLEWVVKFFLHECKKIYSRGIKKGYITEEASLRAVRGQLQVQRTLQLWLKHDYQFGCRYDELTENVKENYIIFCTLADMLHREYEDPIVLKDLREIRNIFGRELDSFTLENNIVPAEQLKEINLLPVTRLNMHYKPAFEWAILYWQVTALSFELGDRKSSSFLLDMNELFEMYIGKRLTKELGRHGMQVSLQKHDSLAEGGKIRIIPDVVIKTSYGREIILDLKYISRRDGSSINSNVFQMLAYLTARKAEHGILLYAGGEERRDSIKNSSFTIHQWSLQLDRGVRREEIEKRIGMIVEKMVRLGTEEASNVT